MFFIKSFFNSSLSLSLFYRILHKAQIVELELQTYNPSLQNQKVFFRLILLFFFQLFPFVKIRISWISRIAEPISEAFIFYPVTNQFRCEIIIAVFPCFAGNFSIKWNVHSDMPLNIDCPTNIQRLHFFYLSEYLLSFAK